MDKKLKILFLAAEYDPLAKVGGLGDVAGSLPLALRSLPHPPDVRVVIPFYPQIKAQGLKTRPIAAFDISHQDGPIRATAVELLDSEFPLYLIDGQPISATSQIYSADNHQDGLKFTFFSLAGLQLAESLNWNPDILHANDWHTSPAVYKLKINRQANDFFHKTRSLLTIHNLPYLGHGTQNALHSFGLPRAHFSSLPEWAQHLPLPLGLLSADLITTVSPGYAAEILTPEFGAGLEDFLLSREHDLRGILNGLDLASWDPQNDPHLAVNFSRDTITVRQENKIALLKELELELNPDLPLLAMINRMDYQKGVDLVPDAFRQIQNLDWQAIILGTGDNKLEKEAEMLGQDLPQVRAIIKYDDGLAHRIYAGSDMILIPSRYEPCGLTQMIGMRYGCVPVARNTGGLTDTILDYDQHPTRSTGFLFDQASSDDLRSAIERALRIYRDKRRWAGLMRRGMKQDFSWERSAKEYLHLYQKLNQNT